MNEGISADEACRINALTAEDFARMCNEDSNIKAQKQETAADTLRYDDSRAVTARDSVLYIGLTGLLLIVIFITIFVINKRRRDKR